MLGKKTSNRGRNPLVWLAPNMQHNCNSPDSPNWSEGTRARGSRIPPLQGHLQLGSATTLRHGVRDPPKLQWHNRLHSLKVYRSLTALLRTSTSHQDYSRHTRQILSAPKRSVSVNCQQQPSRQLGDVKTQEP